MTQHYDRFGLPIVIECPPMPKVKPPKDDNEIILMRGLIQDMEKNMRFAIQYRNVYHQLVKFMRDNQIERL